ncbi:MAG TPA: signal peptidase I [Thermoanaerobaculia bacterium]|nr:signal peptidase I [Thermoanaerobaculia bacterium]
MSSSDPAPPSAGRVARLLRELRQLAIIALLLFTGRSVLADWYQVPTGSMKPTILEGDRVFVLKCAYQIRVPFTAIRLFRTGAPKRGDVVVLRNPDGGAVPLVKRIVGLPGDVVRLDNERLFVNGVPQNLRMRPLAADAEEPFRWVGTENLGGRLHPVQVLPDRPALRTFGPVRVPEGSVFLMGDNRDDSRDARYFGPRPVSDLLGRAEGVFWSWHPDVLKGPRLSRFGRPFAAVPKSS